MKRMAAIAAMAAACALAGTAYGQAMAAWSAPDGAFSVQRPAGWPVDRMSDSSAQVTHYAAGLADAECSFFVIARPESAATPPGHMQQMLTQPMTADQWSQVASSMPNVFHGPVTVQASSVDTSNFWPVQRATLMAGTTAVQSGITSRPGKEVWSFCQSFDSRDRSATFGSIIGSIATPQDAALQAAAEAAAAPAPAPAGH
ncbi:MAG: hypothetical protein AB7L65_01930 [Hyphomonadaceae bacterium]